MKIGVIGDVASRAMGRRAAAAGSARTSKGRSRHAQLDLRRERMVAPSVARLCNKGPVAKFAWTAGLKLSDF